MRVTPSPSPATLKPHYSAFLATDRILLTGHSHQAWPDVAAHGLRAAFRDAALHVDDKWSAAMARASVLRGAVAASLGVGPDEIALGQNSHELVSRFLSGLPWDRGRHIVSTAGEFHSMDRQLRRLAEEGVEVTFVPVAPLETLAARMGEKIRRDTVALMASTVLFRTSAVVPHLTEPVEAAHRVGAAVLLDAYHAFCVVPQTLQSLGPDPIFVTGGGYKYAQWGEGCCWLRVPPESAMRPVFTGWFADFANLEGARSSAVGYGPDGASRFAGSTYDPASHYRAAAVVDFFRAQGLTIEALRRISLGQTQRLIDALPQLTLMTPRAAKARGGFVAFRVPDAGRVVAAVRGQGVFTDARDEILRLGPAPYLTDDELDRGAAVVAEAVARLSPSALVSQQ